MADLSTTQNIINSLTFSGLGIAVLIAAFVLVDLITPRVPVWKEIVEKQNQALGILMAGFLIGVALIIAAAVHG